VYSFLEACLHVESEKRMSTGQLLLNKLFSTTNSSTLRLASAETSKRFNDLEKLLERYRSESEAGQSLVCDELEDKFSELFLCLSSLLERISEGKKEVGSRS
jgi:hypothetical protein